MLVKNNRKTRCEAKPRPQRFSLLAVRCIQLQGKLTRRTYLYVHSRGLLAKVCFALCSRRNARSTLNHHQLARTRAILMIYPDPHGSPRKRKEGKPRQGSTTFTKTKRRRVYPLPVGILRGLYNTSLSSST
ncbi:unnamed protein product [Ectocarpus sp. 12 AP-2014]